MLRILIVDDHKGTRDGVRALLAELVPGAHMDSAPTAASGLQLAFLYDYALIIVDVHLPDGSGLDMIRQIKLVRSRANVLVLTGLPRDPYERQALQSGAQAFVAKRDATYLFSTAVLELLRHATA